jgi:hypothetical protein
MAQLVKVLTAFGVYHGGRESTPVSCALTSVGTLWPCSLCMCVSDVCMMYVCMCVSDVCMMYVCMCKCMYMSDVCTCV